MGADDPEWLALGHKAYPDEKGTERIHVLGR